MSTVTECKHGLRSGCSFCHAGKPLDLRAIHEANEALSDEPRPHDEDVDDEEEQDERPARRRTSTSRRGRHSNGTAEVPERELTVKEIQAALSEHSPEASAPKFSSCILCKARGLTGDAFDEELGVCSGHILEMLGRYYLKVEPYLKQVPASPPPPAEATKPPRRAAKRTAPRTLGDLTLHAFIRLPEKKLLAIAGARNGHGVGQDTRVLDLANARSYALSLKLRQMARARGSRS